MPFVANHRATIYRRNAAGSWQQVASDVPCDLQPLSGSVRQQPYGRETDRKRRGFFTTGFDLRADDGVAVTAGPGGTGNWLVVSTDDWGEPGDLEAELALTGEDFVG